MQSSQTKIPISIELDINVGWSQSFDAKKIYRQLVGWFTASSIA